MLKAVRRRDLEINGVNVVKAVRRRNYFHFPESWKYVVNLNPKYI
jgi:hypothetical protein